MIGIQILNNSTLRDPYKPFPELTVLFIFQFAKIVGQFEGAKGAKPTGSPYMQFTLTAKYYFYFLYCQHKKFRGKKSKILRIRLLKFLYGKIEKKSPKIQGETHLNQLWKLSSPMNSASYDTKITP